MPSEHFIPRANGASVAQWSVRSPFTSEVAGSILSENFWNFLNVTQAHAVLHSCEKSQSTLCRKLWFYFVSDKPTKTKINVPKEAYIGKTLAISCESDGLPVPNYAIIHNGTIVSNEKKYIKGNVQYNHAGTYKCTAMNVLGRNSDSSNLTVIKGKIRLHVA